MMCGEMAIRFYISISRRQRSRRSRETGRVSEQPHDAATAARPTHHTSIKAAWSWYCREAWV